MRAPIVVGSVCAVGLVTVVLLISFFLARSSAEAPARMPAEIPPPRMTELDASELALVRVECARSVRPQGLHCHVFNGSEEAIRAIEVEVSMVDANGETARRQVYRGDLAHYGLASGQSGEAFVSTTFVPGTAQTLRWRLVAARLY